MEEKHKDNKNIILIGFMGCGKTTFGKWIEQNRTRKFIDTDDFIVEHQKCSINDMRSMVRNISGILRLTA